MAQLENAQERQSKPTIQRTPTGVSGLDEVLHGGLVSGRAYLLHGNPGSGKTILGLHF